MPREDKISKEEVRYRMALPYEIKVRMTETRLREFINYYGENDVAISISGGLDSTAGAHFIWQRYPKVKAVSVMGIECKENIEQMIIMRDVWGHDVKPVRPGMSQEAVLKAFGYPVVSKRASKSLNYLQNPTEENYWSRRLALEGLTREDKKAPSFKLAEKWKFLINAPFKIDNKCCYYMKETAVQNYCKENGYASIICTLVEESQNRLDGYCKKGGCNSFEGTGESTPFSFWTKQDILRYLHENKVDISKAYGEIQVDEEGKYYTTKAKRTGCPICMYGMELDGNPNRFQRMYIEEPKRWELALYRYGYKEVLDYFINNGFIKYMYFPAKLFTVESMTEEAKEAYERLLRIGAEKKRELDRAKEGGDKKEVGKAKRAFEKAAKEIAETTGLDLKRVTEDISKI